MTPTHAAHSTTVADAYPDDPLEDLIADLGHRTHDAAVVQYRDLPGVRLTDCSFRAWAGERDGDRQAFEEYLHSVKLDDGEVAKLLGQWDSATRPVAICHWFPVG